MKKPQSLVDVIIPVYGQPKLVEKCVEPLIGIEGINIVFVDDFSPKIDTEGLFEIYKKHKFFRNGANMGFPYTVNVGVSRTFSPLILILNTDVVLNPNALDILIKELDDPTIGIAAPMLIFPEISEWETPGKIQHIGMPFDIKGVPYHAFLGWSVDNPHAVQRRFVRCVTGACFLTRRKLWTQIGGFSLDYGRGTYEDVEFCLNVCALGSRIVVNPEARGTHRVGASSAANKEGFALRQNLAIFKARNVAAGRIKWDEYTIS